MNLITPITLASSSPRRQELLRGIGLEFDVISPEISEQWPSTLKAENVPEYLAKIKADTLIAQGCTGIIIAADTVVIIENSILGKPADAADAKNMLELLSGKMHEVVTGVCIQNKEKLVLFKDKSEVTFKEFTSQEISYYVNEFKPLDKAGAYGIQEWLGMIGVTRINGSYYNVMGLPVHKVYKVLQEW